MRAVEIGKYRDAMLALIPDADQAVFLASREYHESRRAVEQRYTAWSGASGNWRRRRLGSIDAGFSHAMTGEAELPNYECVGDRRP